VAFRFRRRRKELPPLAEGDVRARSYGERSDEVTNVKPMERRERQPVRGEVRLTDRGLRAAFRARLDRRNES
jgi:hypothetical protein